MTDDERWRALGRLEEVGNSLTAQTTRINTELTALRDKVESLTADKERISTELTSVRAKIDKPKPRLERIAGVPAVLAVALSLVKFPADFLNAYVTRTATELLADNQIVFSYSDSERVFEIRWKLDVLNDGNKQERLQIAEASIIAPLPAANTTQQARPLISFDLTSSGFRTLNAETAAPVVTPIFVDEKKPNSVFAVLKLRATKETIREITDRERSRRCIRVKLKGRDSYFPIPDGCFDLFPSDWTAISSGEDFSITFDQSIG